jgi:hypothetical protein
MGYSISVLELVEEWSLEYNYTECGGYNCSSRVFFVLVYMVYISFGLGLGLRFKIVYL